jgi:uncharacterized protein with von Willebrand factor type A (vWA) domain
MSKLRPFSHVVLTLVGRGGAGPHDLVRMMRQGRLYWAAAPSHYYAEPRRLEELGLLRSRVEPGRTRERTHYELTDAGRAAIGEWLQTPVPFPRIQSEPAVRALAADLAEPQAALDGLREFEGELDGLDAELDRLEDQAADLPTRQAMLRRELERGRIERTATLPPSRPLRDLDRALPGGPLQDLAAVHRVVAQLKRRLKAQGQELRGHARHAHVDVRRTMRASLQTGGVPVELRYKPVRPRRPEIYVLCDVSTSVTSASVFFLSVLHALHDSFRKMRSFVFIERISEVTDVFGRERDFRAVSEAIASDAGVADISGYTDYGRVWSELRTLVEDDLHPRATVIVLGDARTNGRAPRADVFGEIAARAGRTFWLNPEPRLYWNYGDSVIAAYEQHCQAFECWTTAQLEDFVKALTQPVRAN